MGESQRPLGCTMYAPPDKDRQPSGYSTLPRGNLRIAELMDPLWNYVPWSQWQFLSCCNDLRGCSSWTFKWALQFLRKSFNIKLHCKGYQCAWAVDKYVRSSPSSTIDTSTSDYGPDWVRTLSIEFTIFNWSSSTFTFSYTTSTTEEIDSVLTVPLAYCIGISYLHGV